MLKRLSLLECSLAADERAERERRLRTLAERAVDSTHDELQFALDPELAAEVAELAAREAVCCGASFRIEIDPAGVRVNLH